eukprot:766181-Pyramimonas_sp.AAC.1
MTDRLSTSKWESCGTVEIGGTRWTGGATREMRLRANGELQVLKVLHVHSASEDVEFVVRGAFGPVIPCCCQSITLNATRTCTYSEEVDMADQNTLTGFISRSIAAYPADDVSIPVVCALQGRDICASPQNRMILTRMSSCCLGPWMCFRRYLRFVVANGRSFGSMPCSSGITATPGADLGTMRSQELYPPKAFDIRIRYLFPNSPKQ